MFTALFAPILTMNLLNYMPWTIIFLITQTFGIRLYYLKKREECIRIQKRVQKWCSHTTDGGKGYGYAIGYWYALNISASITESGDMYNISMIATPASFEALTRCIGDDDEDEEDKSSIKPSSASDILQKKITIWARTGTYQSPWFRQRERPVEEVAQGQQGGMIDKIIEHYKKKRHTVVYIYGPPGTGKSMIASLLAEKLNGSLCNTLKPWQPNDTIDILHSDVEPTKNKPLIIVFDEVDSALLKIHEGIPQHNKIPTMVSDKTGWNHMLDEIQRGMYPNIILLMTSNRTPEFINGLDSSYMREGRVDLTFEMTESLLKN